MHGRGASGFPSTWIQARQHRRRSNRAGAYEVHTKYHRKLDLHTGILWTQPRADPWATGTRPGSMLLPVPFLYGQHHAAPCGHIL